MSGRSPRTSLKRTRVRAGLALIIASFGALPGCGRVGFDLAERVRPGGTGDEPGIDGGHTGGSGGAVSSGGSTALDSGTRANGGAGAGGTGAGGAGSGGTNDAGGAFDGGAAGHGGALPDAGGAVDSAAPVDSGSTPVCALGTVWDFGFDSDPSVADENADGVPDWVMRNATTFPTQELSGGIWHSASRIVLDSRPRNDFAGKTTVDVRMRSTAVPTQPYGAVFWVNVGEQGPNFSALFVSVALVAGGGQTLGLYGKPGNTETLLASVQNLPETMVDVHLDVDTAASSVGLRVNGADVGTYAIPITGAPNGDDFATLLLWDGLAEFDSVRIVACPP